MSVWTALDALKADPDGAPVDDEVLAAIADEQQRLAEALTGALWLHAPGYGTLDERLLALLWSRIPRRSWACSPASWSARWDGLAAVDQADPTARGRPAIAPPRPWWRFWG